MELIMMEERGYWSALLGLGLSYKDAGQSVREYWTMDQISKIEKVATRLAHKDGGHNKFLESINVWMYIKASRGWWAQFDTYRVGTTKQSSSTMHTIMKRPLVQDDFRTPIEPDYLKYLNKMINQKAFNAVKDGLPEGFLQDRVVCTNYKVLKNMYAQRHKHKLEEWQEFCKWLTENLQRKEFITT